MNIPGLSINLLPKVMVISVIANEELDIILTEITAKIGTGTAGDGKVFVYDVADAPRIRTGERGEKAI